MLNMGEINTLIQKTYTNKNKDEDKYTKNVITKNFITHEHKDWNKSLKY
jgi:hypothetical protein